MIAVIEIGGNQYTVSAGDVIDVDNQNTDVKEVISVDPLLVSDADGKETKVGTPTVADTPVKLKVVDNFSGDKIRVFKMKAKKRYARTRGFRPELTRLEVVSIG